MKQKPRVGRRKGRKMPFFVSGDLDLWLLTLTFKLIRDISYANKKVTDSAKNRTLRSSLRAVKKGCPF